MSSWIQGALAIALSLSLTAAAPSPDILPTGLENDILLEFADAGPRIDPHLREMAAIPGMRRAQGFAIEKIGRVGDVDDSMAMFEMSAASASGLGSEVAARAKDGRLAGGDAADPARRWHVIFRPLSPGVLAAQVPGSNAVPLGTGALTTHYLVVLSDATTPEQEDEFNRWYDVQHVPDVMRVPGFVGAQRFIRVGGPGNVPRYLAVFRFVTRDLAATDREIRRRMREGLSVMSPAFGRTNSRGFFATPAGPIIRAAR